MFRKCAARSAADLMLPGALTVGSSSAAVSERTERTDRTLRLAHSPLVTVGPFEAVAGQLRAESGL